MNKYQVFDSATAFHFGVGAAAGVAGADPKLVLLAALVADATWEIIKASSVSAAFEAGHSQSKAKEIVDLLSIIFGAHLGKFARELYAERAEAPAVAPAPAPAPAASGLGMYDPGLYTWRQ